MLAASDFGGCCGVYGADARTTVRYNDEDELEAGQGGQYTFWQIYDMDTCWPFRFVWGASTDDEEDVLLAFPGSAYKALIASAVHHEVKTLFEVHLTWKKKEWFSYYKDECESNRKKPQDDKEADVAIRKRISDMERFDGISFDDTEPYISADNKILIFKSISYCVTFVFIVLSIYATLLSFEFRAGLVDKMGTTVGAAVAGCGDAIMIMIFDWVFMLVVEPLNIMENYQTQTEHDDAKIQKVPRRCAAPRLGVFVCVRTFA